MCLRLACEKVLKLLFTALFVFSGSYLYAQQEERILSYEAYSALNSDQINSPGTLRVSALSFSSAGEDWEIVEGPEEVEGVFVGGTGWLEWEILIPSSGFYSLSIDYFPAAGRGTEIERALFIDGVIPFQEAESLMFQRVWTDIFPDPRRDNRGNDLRPIQEELPCWRTGFAGNAFERSGRPYQFYLSEGIHTVRLQSVREPMVMESLSFRPLNELPSYREYAAVVTDAADPSEGVFLKVQCEDVYIKSDPSIKVLMDRSSPNTEPYHVSKIRLNTLGGRSWERPGEWASWVVDIPADGLYEIAFRIRQNMVRGTFSSRRIYIDGEIPFAELDSRVYPYEKSWNIDILGSETPYHFYLTQGRHEITMEVTLGALAPIIAVVEQSVLELNNLYRRIIMITGRAPDLFRDYHLEAHIPGLMETVAEQAEQISSIVSQLNIINVTESKENIVLDKLIRQLNDFIQRPETIPRRIDAFKSNVGALGSWTLEARKQPLEMDYLVVASPGTIYPPAEAGIAVQLKHALGSFFASFYEDYSSVGNVVEGGDPLEIWVLSARDKAQILKPLVDSDFTTSTGIEVNLKLVDEKILLPAILSGNSPDLVLNAKRAQPVNFALRNAVTDMSVFPGFSVMEGFFSQSALFPYRYGNGVFALPEQEVFEMLFYREDIFRELNLTPPDTWDELFELIPILQKNHLDFGLPYAVALATDQNILPPNPTFSMLLYQNDGRFYNEAGDRSLLNLPESLSAFRDWTDLYTSFKLDQEYNFETRFRTGEMPAAIQRYDQYNTLTIFAPELRGLWKMVPVPGKRMEDGTIRRESISDSTCTMIMEDSDKKEEAWEFVQWWLSPQIQVRFGRELESLLGAGGRYPTANREAVASLPWPAEALAQLESQWRWVRGVAEIPGGYFTGRHLDNAMRRVVFEGDNPRDTMLDYVDLINDEIIQKRKELKLDE